MLKSVERPRKFRGRSAFRGRKFHREDAKWERQQYALDLLGVELSEGRSCACSTSRPIRSSRDMEFASSFRGYSCATPSAIEAYHFLDLFSRTTETTFSRTTST